MWHNADIRPNYAIDKSGNGLWFDKNGIEAQRLKEQIIAQAKENYKTHCKARNKAFQAKSYEWSAVVNLKPDSTRRDLAQLKEHFATKYGFQCYQIAIHRDEGHINEQGEKVINHHAHLEFITLDKETGKNRFRGSLRTPKALSQMQKEVALILQMERGISGAKRIEPRAYGAMKEREKAQNRERNQKIEKSLESAHETIETKNAEIATLKGENENLKATIKDIKAEFELKRKAWIDEQNKTKDDYRALSALKQDCLDKRNLTLEQVREFIENLENQLKNGRKIKKMVELENKFLRDEISALKNQITQGRQVMDTKEVDKVADEINNFLKEKLKIADKVSYVFENNSAKPNECKLDKDTADKVEKKLKDLGYKTKIKQDKNAKNPNFSYGVIFAKTDENLSSVNVEIGHEQQETAQIREISHESSSAANIEQQSSITPQTPQGVAEFTAFEGGFYTSKVSLDLETATSKASEIQKQGFKIAIFKYKHNDKYGFICALKTIYNEFKAKFIAKHKSVAQIVKEIEPKEPKIAETKQIKDLSDESLSAETQISTSSKSAKFEKPNKSKSKDKTKQKSKSNDNGMGM